MPISDKLIDQLLEGNNSPEDLPGEDGLLKELTKRVAERALESENDHHLGYSKLAPKGHRTGNSRNGRNGKTVISVHGEIEIDVTRDRNVDFEPKLVKKDEKQLNGFDDRIISLYSRGMTSRDIQAHFMDAYGAEVSATFISQVTNAVMDEVRAWRNRPLDSVYPVVYLDALVERFFSIAKSPTPHLLCKLETSLEAQHRYKRTPLEISPELNANHAHLAAPAQRKRHGVLTLLRRLPGFHSPLNRIPGSVSPVANDSRCLRYLRLR